MSIGQSTNCMSNRFHKRREFHKTALEATGSPTTPESNQGQRRRIAIVGGGLAGLSTTYHLLKKMLRDDSVPSTPFSHAPSAIDIEIIDTAEVGAGGASSVAGGLLHPLSPRGKLVPLGLEGLASTNELLQHAGQFEPSCVLRNELYRIALTNQHVKTLKETSQSLPNMAEWIDYEKADTLLSTSSSPIPESVLGALRLHAGCKVIHVPSYLKGLLSACSALTSNHPDKATVKWSVEPELSSPDFDWSQRLSDFDIVVLSAGAGLFQQHQDGHGADTSNLLQPDDFPATLVRGQSIELLVKSDANDIKFPHALLCGKYVCPLPQSDKVMIGATHEFQPTPWDEERVEDELKELSYPFASHVWDPTSIIDRKITSGIRVQSNRGTFGRFPMIGRYRSFFDESSSIKLVHDNVWIFTGLSSRGLLYHGVFGDMLTNLILQRDNHKRYDSTIVDYLDWWKRQKRKIDNK